MWASVPVANPSLSRVLLLGASGTGKTSHGFDLAYQQARSGDIVLFVCIKAKVDRKFPHMVKCIRGNEQTVTSRDESNEWDKTEDNNAIDTLWVPGVLKNIHMKYVNNAKELSEVFASIHIFQPAPNCIIVDDYSQIISSLNSSISNKNNRDVLLSMNSLIDNAVAYMTSKNPSKNKNHISLLLIDDDSNDPNYMAIMSRLAPKTLILKHFHDPEDIDNLTIRCFISSYNSSDQVTISNNIKMKKDNIYVHI